VGRNLRLTYASRNSSVYIGEGRILKAGMANRVLTLAFTALLAACSASERADQAPPDAASNDAASTASVPCAIDFEEPFSLDQLPPLPDANGLVAIGITVQYGSYYATLQGDGAPSPSSGEARRSIEESLTGLLDAMLADQDIDSSDVQQTRERLLQVRAFPPLLKRLQLLGSVADAEAYANSTGRRYSIAIAPPPSGSSARAQDTSDLLHNSGQESDWHPFGGSVTWFKSGDAPGLLLKFWFDGQGWLHYDDQDAAYELQVDLPSGCYEQTPWTAIVIDDELPEPYQDWNCGFPDSQRLENYGFGTAQAQDMIPWHAYWGWIPLRPRQDRPSSCASSELRLWSQPSYQAPIGVAIGESTRACSVFSRNYLVHTPDPADDENAMLAFLPSDAADGQEVHWARNMCDVTSNSGNTEYTGFLAPCIFLSEQPDYQCFVSAGDEYRSCPESASLCSFGACQSALLSNAPIPVIHSGHGFTRNETARCIVRRQADGAVGLSFDTAIDDDSGFAHLLQRPAQPGQYTMQCTDLHTGFRSNAVDFRIWDAPGQCSCDNDGDGYAHFGCIDSDCPLGGDCDDSNSNVNPGQGESCGNMRDDDCNSSTSDTCPIMPSCPAGDGLYCGVTTLGQAHGALYRCTASNYTLFSDCDGLGCVVHPPGIDDECQTSQASCGDHMCSATESCGSCPADCCAPPGAPTLLSPETGATFPSTATITLAWSAIASAVNYEVSVYHDPALTSFFYGYSTVGPETSWTHAAPSPEIYYWTVRARVGTGWSAQALPWFFAVAPPSGGGCGNGAIDSGEACDGTNLGGATCLPESGAPRCTSACTLDFSTCCMSECTPNSHRCSTDFEETCVDLDDDGCYSWGDRIHCDYGCENSEVCRSALPPPGCGNNIVEGTEECDGTTILSYCMFEGFDQGTLSCNACHLDTSGCCSHDQGCDAEGATRCVGGAQQTCHVSGPGGCRHWTAPATCPSLTCNGGVCAASHCGNGIREAGEVCDSSELGGGTCSGQGFDQGALGCSSACAYDTSGCCEHDPGCDVAGATRCVGGAQQTCQPSGPGGCRHWATPVPCESGACSGDVCATAVCSNGVVETGEACDGAALGGATCISRGYDAGTLSCDATCHFNEAGCCLDQCMRWETTCQDSTTQLVCNDFNNDGCVEWGGSYTCPCENASCSGDCFPFALTLPSGTNATNIWYWPAAGDFIAEIAVTSSGGTFDSPPGACSATLEYPNRWASWLAGTFPSGAPQGAATLAFPGAGTVGLCELQAGQAAWGVAHDGDCHD